MTDSKWIFAENNEDEEIDEETKEKIEELTDKYSDNNINAPFGMRMLMCFGELAQYLYENDAGGNENA